MVPLQEAPTNATDRRTLKRRRRPRTVSILLSVVLVVLVGARINTRNLLEQRKLQQPSYHPPPFRSRQRRWKDDPSKIIRYLTLGGRQGNKEQSYPFLLSERVPNNNAAQQGAGATRLSLCAQSIIGDDAVYDVIVLDFSPQQTALALLAQRLRQRFPFATFIFVQPYLSPHKEEDNRIMTSLVEQVQGHVYHLPPTNPDSEYWLLATNEASIDDQTMPYTLSPKGHALVANGIRQMVQEQQMIGQNPNNRNTLGTWGSGDKCQLWYETGKEDSPITTTLPLHQFGIKSDRYALEVAFSGSISIANPFATDRMVYLTYMTTSMPYYSNKMYPTTRVQINNKNSVLLDPYHNDNNDNSSSQSDQTRGHVMRTSAIGKVAPGVISKISFQVMEEFTVAPFRIVGISILPDDEKQHHTSIALEFAMGSPEPVEVVERDLDVL